MKLIKHYIAEAFKINKNTKLESRYKYFPETKEELVKIIDRRIETEGITCDLNDIDVSKIKDMSNLFCNSDFNGDISRWDVSNVTDMNNMFKKSEFNQDISKWNVSNVYNMYKMFYYSKFNGDLSNWNVSNVHDMSFMFNGSGFDGKNGDLSNWNVSKVLYMAYMFKGSKIDTDFLNQIKSWNISKRADFDCMFTDTPFFKDEDTINEISKLWDYPFKD